MAGIIGVDPGPLTLRELLAMAEARQREAWSRLSVLLALLANCHRDPKKTSPYRPRDFDPFARPEPKLKADVSVLKDVFIERSRPRHGSPGH